MAEAYLIQARIGLTVTRRKLRGWENAGWKRAIAYWHERNTGANERRSVNDGNIPS